MAYAARRGESKGGRNGQIALPGFWRDCIRRRNCRTMRVMWNDPYMETCCRSALHRLALTGASGRPASLKDGPCLTRLSGMGLAETRTDGRFVITDAGTLRHVREVLKRAGGGAEDSGEPRRAQIPR